MRALAFVVVLALIACDDGPGGAPAGETSSTALGGGEPREVDAMATCATHADCRVLSGVCESPTPVNVAHVAEMERMIEVRGRHRSCRAPMIPVAETTAACVRGGCVALLGPAEEHRCEDDAGCVVARGLCGPTEAIAAGARDAFEARVDELLAAHIRCGYGRVDTSIRAVCDDGMCVPGE